MVFCYTSCGLGPCQSLFTEIGTIFESSHIAGIGSRVTKDVPVNVLRPLFSAETHTGGAGVHQPSLNRQVPLHAVVRITQLQTPLSQGHQRVQMLLCVHAASPSQCSVHA